MSLPSVLCIAGHDPTGGAGIQADIEAVSAQGAHALTLITALTVQDTHNVQRLQAVDSALFGEQAECLLRDCRISAVKLGLLGDQAQVQLIATWLRRLRVPTVLDPILRAGGGTDLLGHSLAAAMQEQLFPLATVLLPNAAEARRLSGHQDLHQAGAALLCSGAANVLITGGDEGGDEVLNHWFQHAAEPVVYRWPRVEGGFHGAGCTLASALAARLARGESMATALQIAQDYTHQALVRGHRPGQGRRVPGRGYAPERG
ncbi:MAG: hydroxymethylpyrimidine/phosphomethylpyrimidine kinase [Stagnimonas sp.]|nr:hydroxymethylpyrimidine/phosphomethylpyrimidine kinase [Stagnimonas sp.]